ncbi:MULTISPECIES: aldose epimerase family protein [Rhizobium]|uniref:Aldose 1-epimerase n=1 Tax=Rhizobium favelukesii TaxID=348824 RepID=W6RH63_9HYPH|nr:MULTISPECIES: aldose epimerase family protein [Rhizobium]MCA0803724.1 galactose mutarotase [Rhizobium sp. T1473]MCS0457202.1 galactose mutarotase [Rhizobium favelukesii]UFS82709.1 galactose mutarotase [Rhizobium sp. T136]CDM59710.1 aldose 1-epimerase [Rhizobium favelukesii]
MAELLKREVFGQTKSGETVYRIEIKGGGLTAKIITWGAVIQDLRLDDHDAPLLLGFDDFDSYPAHSSYFGATPGRCANRIGGGRFTLDGKNYQLDLNEKGVTHLHGGSDNIAKQNWTIVEHDVDRVVLKIVDPDGRAGYPGNCTIQATYWVHGNGEFSVVYESTSDQPTIANVCQHAYFNLDGRDDALGHDIMIAADGYLVTDELQVPTGEIRPVAGTVFDFREMSPMKRFDGSEQALYDHNFCLSDDRTAKRSVALARSLNSGVSLEVRTTEPGVQFYAAFKLNVPVPGLGGRKYGPFAGFCLETQIWPDAINHEGFPDAVLRPGEVLRQETDYVFTKS